MTTLPRSPEGAPAGAIAAARPALHVPALIKRNMTLFALALSFTGAGMQFAYGFGPLMVESLTGSAALAGLSVALIGFSRFLISYPIGRVTDRFGRKPGIQMGLAIALAGALIIGASMAVSSFAVFVVGILVFGMGMNAAQQLRVAATDMFPPVFRGRALGYLSLGTLLGLAVSPVVVGYAEELALRWGTHPLALPWYLLPFLILPGMGLIQLVRPDPKTIGMNLEDYYPGYAEMRRPGAAVSSASSASTASLGPLAKFSALTMMREPQMMLAIVSNSAAIGNMSVVMVLTSLVLSHHGHSLTAIAISHMFHSAGMFAFTVPLGWLTDRVGRTRVMYPGVGVALVGASLVAHTDGSYALVTAGTFLVGIGWAAANVAATAIIADRYPSQQRGRAIGVAESWSGATSMGMALLTGPLIHWSGLPATGFAAMLLAGVPFALWVAVRAK